MTDNPQLTQQAHQYREHRQISQLSQVNNWRLGQRARRNNEDPFGLLQLPIARRPLLPQTIDTPSLPHRLTPCNISCSFCEAYHWIEERVQGSAKSAPQFSTCCDSGTIAMGEFE